MKLHRNIFFVMISLISYSAYSQQHSALYLKVDSIMRYQLKYNVDSAEIALNNRPNKPKFIIRDAPENVPFPLIVLNGKLIDRKDLQNYTLASVKTVRVFTKNQVSNIFGSGAKYGVIIITTKRKKKSVHIP